MSKIKAAIIVALMATATSAPAQTSGHFPYDGDIQAYGAPWRYQHRDWSRPWRPANPGVCWYFNNYTGEWVWEC